MSATDGVKSKATCTYVSEVIVCKKCIPSLEIHGMFMCYVLSLELGRIVFT